MMLKIVQKHIKTNVAQFTDLFDISTQNVEVITQNNLINCVGLDGEYTLTKATDGYASKGCLNDTIVFTNGLHTSQDCFFGNEETTHNLIAKKINVGTAISRDLALEMILDKKVKNCIIVYLDTLSNNGTEIKTSLSQDMTLKLNYKIGVIFKIKAKDLENIGCVNTDIGFISSVLGIGSFTSSLLQFVGLNDRFFAGENYCVDFGFEYNDIVYFDKTIQDRLKHFRDTLINIEVKGVKYE